MSKNENKKVIEQLKDDPLMPLRHSAEHVLHTAMEELYPKLKKVMGPPIENGFYIDFDLDQNITPDDFEEIEKRMKEIIDESLDLKMKEITLEEARKIFKDNEYKLDKLDEIEQANETITICEMGSENTKHHDIDLCAGPHVDNTNKIKAFKLLSVAGAYYKGDENNKMLQRIYATAFDNKRDLEDYLEALEKSKENDHRKVNQFMDLFTFSDLVGRGLVMFTPNGTIVKNELRDYLLDVSKKHGAKEVNIPHIANIELYEKSGHAEKFAEELFKVQSHYEENLVLKPVNCPHHTQIYAHKLRSYRDLPIAYVESTQQHRDEKPGSMSGLNRTRSFEIDDGHTFCTPEQVKDEVIKLLDTVKDFYKALGMWGEHWVSLSFRDLNTPEKYIGTDEEWEKAESVLLEVNDELKLGGKVIKGEAALYGPKIDIMLKDSLGNDRQLGTVQVDFSMPSRFELSYIDENGEKKTPVMLHRAILGSYGRFIAYLMESTGGAFPVWLAPTQIQIIPISQDHVEYANKIVAMARDMNLRIEVNDRDDTMGAKIRDAQIQKIPYMFIVGDREVKSNKVSLRLRTEEDLGSKKIEDVLKKIKKIYVAKKLELW